MTEQPPEVAFAGRLEPGERVLWSGRPRQGFVLRASDAFAIPFSVMWGGFAIFWEVGVLGSDAPGFFAFFGIPFVVMGLYITVGRFFVDRAQRARTVYALTDRRVLILSGLRSIHLKSLLLRTLAEITLSEKRDGSGTIAFGTPPPGAAFMPAGWPGMQTVPSFEMIPRARDVYARIRQAQTAS